MTTSKQWNLSSSWSPTREDHNRVPLLSIAYQTNCMEETIVAMLHWRTMHSNMHNVKTCINYMHGEQQWNWHGKLWLKQVLLKYNNHESHNLMHVTLVDPVLRTLEIEEISTVVTANKKELPTRSLTRYSYFSDIFFHSCNRLLTPFRSVLLQQ